MPSPFPGMNPFLEQDDAWEDFHHGFITRAQAMLADQAGDNYIVKVETRLYVHELSAEERRFRGRADVGISLADDVRSNPSTASVATRSAPIELTAPAVDVEKYSFLEIRERRNRRVVTAIELLSPTNKTPGPDRDDYLRKRLNYFQSPCHFVEIDLRRGGSRPSPPDLPGCDYFVLLNRIEQRPRIGVWPLSLADRLPQIPIPLKAPDADITLDLQVVLDRTYDGAHYGNYIYRETPEPELTPEQHAWAKQFLPKTSSNIP